MRKTVVAALALLLPVLATANDAAKQRAIETNLATPVAIEGAPGKALEVRMKELNIPAISYAVVEEGKVVLAVAHGLADIAERRPAMPSTLFQAASISKPVSAMGVMELVERGRLSLDVPVNSILRTWKLPENDFTATTPVTLRSLLSHSGGTTVHGFPGYARDAQRPTLTQVLEGKPPANTAPVVVNLAPNREFRYSGGGTTLMQAAIVDHTGLPFPDFMRRTVLRPLGMTASTYEQPLPPSRRGEAATAYGLGAREVAGKWHVYPEMAAAGLWTTPSDLAKVILEMQNALAGRTTRLLSIDAARHMVTPRLPAFPGASIGLGFFVEQRGDASYFSHNGANEGFRSLLIASMDGSRGAVVMTNSDSGGRLAQDLVLTIAREYGWPGYQTEPLRVASQRDDRFAGRYQHDKEFIAIRRNGEHLEVLDLFRGWQKLYPLTDGTLARTDRNLRYALTDDGIALIENPTAATPKRTPVRRLPADSPMTADELLSAERVEEAMTAYREQFRTEPEELKEKALNDGGYAFLSIGRIPQALALLQLNTEFYPTSANTYDSLSEALQIAGEKTRARAVAEELLRRIDADPTASAGTKEQLRRTAQARLKALRE